MDQGRAREIRDGISSHLFEIEKKARELIDGGWSAQIALFNGEDEKVAFINPGELTDEDMLAVSVRGQELE